MPVKKKPVAKKPTAKKAKPKAVKKTKPLPGVVEETKPRKGTENLIPWKPGVSGNPLGGQMHDKEMRMIKNLSKQELKDVANLVIKGNIKALLNIKDDDDATVLKRMLASVAVRIINKGDMHDLDVLLNRLIGKVKEELDLTGDMTHRGARVTVTLPSNGREAKNP